MAVILTSAILQLISNFYLLQILMIRVFFGTDNNRLIKSEDHGTTFSIVDTSDIQTSMPGLGFYYDVNQFHIYRLNRSNGKFTLNVSNNKGNAFTGRRLMKATLNFLSQ